MRKRIAWHRIIAIALVNVMLISQAGLEVYASDDSDMQAGLEVYESDDSDMQAELEVYESDDSDMQAELEVYESDDTDMQEDIEGLLIEPAVADEAVSWSVEASAAASMATVAPTVPAVVNATGNIIVGITGTYYTETAEKILNRLNAIRKEACDKGYIDPYSKKKLTSSDYKPLKWSSDMEAIARQRAAEAALLNGHTRLNKKSCWDAVTTNRQQSWGENLAWNWGNDYVGSKSALMQGIEQWYDERDDYVNKVADKVTGHYESIISTRYKYVAVAAFRNSNDRWYCVAQEFSDVNGLDETKDSTAGPAEVKAEVASDYINKISFSNVPKAVAINDTGKITAKATISIPDYYGQSYSYTFNTYGMDFKSSDSSILSIDSAGNYTTYEKEGTVTLTISGGKASPMETTIRVLSEDKLISLTLPKKTTYVVGESISYTGGSIYNELTGKSEALSKSNATGFDSSSAGIKTIKVTAGKYTKEFKILVVDKPVLELDFGSTYADINSNFPENDYGVYSINGDSATILNAVGEHSLKATFTPNDLEEQKLSTHSSVPVTVTVKRDISAQGMKVTYDRDLSAVTYEGTAIEPTVTLKADGKALKAGQDYTVMYSDNTHDNRNVASGGVIVIEGKGFYKGSIKQTFDINKARISIIANSYRIASTAVSSPMYRCNVFGVLGSDRLVKNQGFPEAICLDIDTQISGSYDIGEYVITPNADAFRFVDAEDNDVSGNYDISIINGKLTVYDSDTAYEVTYSMNGHGAAPTDKEFTYIRAGKMINKPADPDAEGYIFKGWYKDYALTQPWDFTKDIVNADVTLYASWARNDNEFSVSAIPAQYYTGSAIKPKIEVYDGDVLLKSGKDYTVKYEENINISSATNRPKVIVTGKGNYSDTKRIIFEIKPTSINNEDTDELASGFSVSGKDVFSTSNSAIKPITAVKYKKSLKLDTDYLVKITPLKAYDAEGEVLPGDVGWDNLIPAKYFGSFNIKITGKGAYCGEYNKTIYITDSKHQISAATVSIATSYKSAPYDEGHAITIPRGAITVKCGGKNLVYGKDYTVSYKNNTSVGTASVVIRGVEPYYGSKSATFQITGLKFDKNTVAINGLPTSIMYTGKSQAPVVKDSVLTYMRGKPEEKSLKYGVDYTISYKNNLNAGTMTVIYNGKTDSGFKGSISKTVKITPCSIVDESIKINKSEDFSASYTKSGAKIDDKISIINTNTGRELTIGKDYTISYTNNKAIGDKNSQKKPTITVKGKGNYSGVWSDQFSIVPCEISNDSAPISIVTSAQQYSASKKDGYEYKPRVTVKDGKSSLGSRDVTIKYVNCDQQSIARYLQSLESKQELDYVKDIPHVVITAVENGAYEGELGATYNPACVLNIFRDKLSSSNIYAVIDESGTAYTGNQCTPNVTVYKAADSTILKAIKRCTNEDEIINAGGIKLVADKDYAVGYGTNITAGKNGSVIISGKNLYSGSVTVKFTINKRKLTILED